MRKGNGNMGRDMRHDLLGIFTAFCFIFTFNVMRWQN